jgi:hypothetical protein
MKGVSRGVKERFKQNPSLHTSLWSWRNIGLSLTTWGRRFARDWWREREEEGDGLERRESKLFLSTLERENKWKMNNFGTQSK